MRLTVAKPRMTLKGYEAAAALAFAKTVVKARGRMALRPCSPDFYGLS